ncbi:MAG: hypothetical protein AAF682_00785 [Planctomycetota bacterium]
MTDHRRVQRALFRMQMDAAFAARIAAGEGEAEASTGLADDDLALLRALDPEAVAADARDQRKGQLLGNLASEFGLTALAAPDGLLPSFLSSPEFHDAIASDALLPLAFGAFAKRTAAEEELAGVAAMARLELGMARLRRSRGDAPPLAEDELSLSPRAALVELQEGTLAWASELSEARALGQAPRGASLGAATETVLLVADQAPPHRLPDVRPELLEPAARELLTRCTSSLDRSAQAELATDLGASLEELDGFVASLVAEGVLRRG